MIVTEVWELSQDKQESNATHPCAQQATILRDGQLLSLAPQESVLALSFLMRLRLRDSRVLPSVLQATVIRGKVYVFGGEDVARRPTRELRVLDLQVQFSPKL